MFVALQFPFSDVRGFLTGDTNRLKKPAWPLPIADLEFLRSFGIVKRRLRGGIIDWPGEEVYCGALRAVQFDNVTIGLPGSAPESESTQFCAFRRFLADGGPVARYEVGLGFRARHSRRRRSALRTKDFLGLLHFVLSQEVSVTTGPNQRTTCNLIEADKHVALNYLRASTLGSAFSNAEKWWLMVGSPAVLLEYDSWAVSGFPKHAKEVESPTLADAAIDLAHMWIDFKGRHVGVWLLGHTRFDDEFEKVNRDILRRLRLNLFRIHAERESIRNVLRLIAQNKIDVSKGSDPSEKLQTYLNRAMNVLSKRSYEGLPQSQILDVAYKAEDFVSEGERATLLAQLSEIRVNIRRNVERFTRPGNQEESTIYSINNVGRVTIVHQPNRSETVNNQTLNIQNSTVGDINQVAAQTIQDSFNKAAESDASAELKENLAQLNGAVAEMLKHLPEPQQKQAAQDLKVLTDEVLSESPRRKWYELSAEGLISAAKTVGEIAAPVITAAKAVMGLLSAAS